MACTKKSIIERIAEENNLSPIQAKDAIENLLEIMKDTLADGEDVMLSGFGKFQVKEKAPRRGRNPATGRDLILDQRRVVTFKISGKLKNEINEKQRNG